MRKLIVPFLFLLLSSATVYAQQSAKFSVFYKPGNSYIQVLKQATQTQIKYSGPQEMMDAMKENGKDSVMETKGEMTMESILKTGKADKKGVFPVVLEFTTIDIGIAGGNLQKGTKLFGHAGPGQLPVYDSAAGPGLDADKQQEFIAMMNNMISQINLPDTVMKPGDVYKHSAPISIPLGMATLDMQIETLYKLKSISDGVGYFDIDQTYTGSSAVEQMNMPFKGNSTGKMEMDIVNSFARKYVLDTEIVMNTSMQKMEMNIKSLIHMETDVKLGK